MTAVVICDENVYHIYKKQIQEGLILSERITDILMVQSGENSKSLEMCQALSEKLMQKGYGKDVTFIGIGGGVTLDLVGFLASIYCRGVPWIAVPTTLLAMIDASIGGKTAVNLKGAKNWLGSYHFARQTIIYPFFLHTLADQDWENGIAEILKIYLLTSRDYFLGFAKIPIEWHMAQAIEAKRRIIAKDPEDSGYRAILNLGHTTAHAIEALSNYHIPHGKAVGIGIIIEARLSHEMGILSQADLREIEQVFFYDKLPFTAQAVIRQMELDKKNQNKKPHFVLLQEIGQVYIRENRYCHAVDENRLIKVLNDACVRSC